MSYHRLILGHNGASAGMLRPSGVGALLVGLVLFLPGHSCVRVLGLSLVVPLAELGTKLRMRLARVLDARRL